MIDLSSLAQTLLTPGKGILAADESVASADKRLLSFGIEPSEEIRREYRDLFLNTPGVENYLTGVILYQETLDQKGNDGLLFPESLRARGIIPGIKVDEGLEPISESPKETITKGLIGLPERLEHFRETYGTGFTKWRAVVRIEGDTLPTSGAIVENAKRLAEYAYLVQQSGMVPIIEPEVLLEGTHSRMRAREVLVSTLEALMTSLADRAVDFSGVILKTAMAVSGSESGKTDTCEEVAEDTVGALIETVPSALAGVVFLSGGQTPEQATDHLACIAKKAQEVHAPWPLTFSYARALQEEALTLWQGNPENLERAREAYIARLDKVQKALHA
jgi:fructose-bisphosphate aldolase class I